MKLAIALLPLFLAGAAAAGVSDTGTNQLRGKSLTTLDDDASMTEPVVIYATCNNMNFAEMPVEASRLASAALRATYNAATSVLDGSQLDSLVKGADGVDNDGIYFTALIVGQGGSGCRFCDDAEVAEIVKQSSGGGCGPFCDDAEKAEIVKQSSGGGCGPFCTHEMEIVKQSSGGGCRFCDDAKEAELVKQSSGGGCGPFCDYAKQAVIVKQSSGGGCGPFCGKIWQELFTAALLNTKSEYFKDVENCEINMMIANTSDIAMA